MDRQLLLELALAFLLVMFGAAPWVLPRFDDRTRPGAGYQRAWTRVAARAGLSFDAGTGFAGARVTGHYRSRSLALSLLPVRSKLASPHTSMRMGLRQPVDGSLTIAAVGRAARLRRRLASRTGHAAPDTARLRFDVASTPGLLAERLLASPALRRKLSQAGPLRLELQGSHLVLTQPVVLLDAEYIVFLFDLMNDVARLIEQA
jgi:hypothetical protein